MMFFSNRILFIGTAVLSCISCTKSMVLLFMYPSFKSICSIPRCLSYLFRTSFNTSGVTIFKAQSISPTGRVDFCIFKAIIRSFSAINLRSNSTFPIFGEFICSARRFPIAFSVKKPFSTRTLPIIWFDFFFLRQKTRSSFVMSLFSTAIDPIFFLRSG